MGGTSNKYSVASEHLTVLQQVVQDRSVEEAIIRSYKRSFNGFSAKLTQQEYENLKSMKEVVSVFPSRTLQLQTTRSWDFLGLPEPTLKEQTAASDVIIGVMDTGIWPESPSFNDDGLSPVPRKWKGVCHGGQNFTCNKKIVGARVYAGNSARDNEGHGSHTASTAAGRIVNDVSFFGIAKGSARGGLPSARIAVYKVCNPECNDTDVLAAFDDAIADGVDFIMISMGGPPVKLEEDAIAIGALHAVDKGVLTVHSAGNGGNSSGSIGSVAPWLLSVAASTTDRRIIDKLVLGDGKILTGNNVNAFTLKGKHFPLVYGKSASNNYCDEYSAKKCIESCLDRHRVKGKIVICDSILPYEEAYNVGAVGVVAKYRFENVSFPYPLPAASLNSPDFEELESYFNSTKAPTAKILKSEIINDTNAPVVAQFSSRGPNTIASDILKPDITAPGVDILAAYSPQGPLNSEIHVDNRKVLYNVLSGTSMACPHVAGAAAYVKSIHPDWSPSAIKSALMTTADKMGTLELSDAEFGYGSGQMNPIKALNPGLVYETTQNDYITFLCKLGYHKKLIISLTNYKNVTCPKKLSQSPNDVNYPSMSAVVDADEPFSVKFTRSVTNVGCANSTYTAKVTSGKKVQIKVEPSSLSFKSLKEIKSFNVSVIGKGISALVSASLVWTDGVHSVRSPIVVYTS